MDSSDPPPPWSYVNFNRVDDSSSFDNASSQSDERNFLPEFQHQHNQTTDNHHTGIKGFVGTSDHISNSLGDDLQFEKSVITSQQQSDSVQQPDDNVQQQNVLSSLQGSFPLTSSAQCNFTQTSQSNMLTTQQSENFNQQTSSFVPHLEMFSDMAGFNDVPQSTEHVKVDSNHPLTSEADFVQEWCQICEKMCDVSCTEHKLTVIKDKVVLSRAWASIPGSLHVFQLPDDGGIGVVAKRMVRVNSRFGPFCSPLVDEKSEVQEKGFLLPLKNNDGTVSYLNPVEEVCCNWMMFVRPATDQSEQNLAAFQQGTEIYYTTTRNIGLREELRVWYSKEYGKLVSSPPLKNAKGKVHCCQDCNRMFTTLEALQRHNRSLDCKAVLLPRRSRSRRKGIPVKKSNDYDMTSRLRRPGRRVAHLMPDAWHCGQCKLSFDDSGLLKLHKLTHTEDEQQEEHPESQNCPECGEKFMSKKRLAEHISTEHGEEKRTIKRIYSRLECDVCGENFSSQNEKNDHVSEYHKDVKPFLCERCGMRFKQNSSYSCHLRKHERGNFYRCSVCPESFPNQFLSEAHGVEHMVDGKFPCPKCPGKTFDTYIQIRKHMRSIHSGREFPCTVCGKIFARADKLRVHSVIHSSVREFMCDMCGKQFGRKDKLKEHIKRMHSEVKVGSTEESKQSRRFIPKVAPSDYQRFIYKCQECATGFKRRGMLINHLAKRHPNTTPSSIPELNLPILRTQKKYFCLHCNRVYKSNSKRRQHILKAHPGQELPPSGKIPLDMQGMTNPYATTIGSVTTLPLPCNYCHKQYASRSKLISHVRSKHPDQAPPIKKRQPAHALTGTDVVQLMPQTMDQSQEPLTIALQPITIGGDGNRSDTDLLSQAMTVNELHHTLDYQPQTMEYRLVGGNGQMTIDLGLQGTGLLAVPTSIALSSSVPASSSAAATVPSSQGTLNVASSPRTTWPYTFKLN